MVEIAVALKQWMARESIVRCLLQGQGEAAICDAQGNNCQRFPGCSTIQGVRVAVDAPSCP